MIATGRQLRILELLGVQIQPERLADTARRAGIAGFIAITAAAFALVWSVFTNDFSITYIVSTPTAHCRGRTSSPRCGAGRRFAAALAWLLGTYGFVLRLRHNTDVKLYAYAGTILVEYRSSFWPFSTSRRRRSHCEGRIPGDATASIPCSIPGEVIHPPMLYLGYVGFSVPFAFALAR